MMRLHPWAALSLLASVAIAGLTLLVDLPPEPGGRLVRGIFFGVACGQAVAIAALFVESRFNRAVAGWVAAWSVAGLLLCPDLTRWMWLPLLPLVVLGTECPGRWTFNPTVWAMLAGVPSGIVILTLGDTWVFDPWFEALGRADRPALLETFPAIGWLTIGQFLGLTHLAATIDERRAARWALASLATWVVVDSAIGMTAGGAFNIAVINLPVMAFYLPFLIWRARVA